MDVFPAEAPFALSDANRRILSQPDNEFKCHDWDEVCQIIGANNLGALMRKPSDLRRYIQWTAKTKAEFGSMAGYLLSNLLPNAWGYPPFQPQSTTPYAHHSDFRVLLNDWPYGFAVGISHIVVWSRTSIEIDPQTGYMTSRSRQIVDGFVKRFFVERLGPEGEDRVLWFKNWVGLQSVPCLEHIHVLVRDASPKCLEEWTAELACHRLG